MALDISTYGRATAKELISTWIKGGPVGAGQRNLKLSAFSSDGVNEVSCNMVFGAPTSTVTYGQTGTGVDVKITGVSAVPTANSDVANKKYVDDVAQGLDVKEAVVVATLTELTGTYASVSAGVGDTFTITATGVLNIDGRNLVVGDRVLIKDQTTNRKINGIYTVTTAGAVGVSAVFTRAIDFNTPSKCNAGSFVFVSTGTQAGFGYVLTSTITSISATTGSDFVFTVFSSAGAYSEGQGISLNSSTIAVRLKTVANPVLAFNGNDVSLMSRTNYNGAVLVSGATTAIDPVFSYKIGPTDTAQIPTVGLLTINEVVSRTVTGAETDGGLVIESTNSANNGEYSPSLYIGRSASTGTYRTTVVGNGTTQTMRVERRGASGYVTLFTVEP